MYKLLSRKLLGERYSGIIRGIMIAGVIGGGLSGLDVKLAMAQSVLIITMLCSAGIIVYQSITSRDNAKYLKGFFTMPYDDRRSLFEYAAVIGLYTLFTKTAIVIGLLMAFAKLTALDGVLIAISFLYALFGVMCAFAYRKRAPYVSVLIAAAGVAMAFLLPKGWIAVAGLAVSDIVLFILFMFSSMDDFRVVETSKSRRVRSTTGYSKTPKFLVPKYLMRYLLINKSAFVSSLFLMAFGVFFAWNGEKTGIPMTIGMSMGLIVINTQIGTIVSSSRTLKGKLESMPNKVEAFYVPYALFLFVFYIICYALFLTALFAIRGGILIRPIILAPIFSLEAAIANVILEDKFTLTKWKAEPDLWHHPRKYIVPGVLVLEAALVFMI
jgi:hypothetical protein